MYAQSRSQVSVRIAPRWVTVAFGVSRMPGHAATTPRRDSCIAVRTGARLVFGVPSA